MSYGPQLLDLVNNINAVNGGKAYGSFPQDQRHSASDAVLAIGFVIANGGGAPAAPVPSTALFDALRVSMGYLDKGQKASEGFCDAVIARALVADAARKTGLVQADPTLPSINNGASGTVTVLIPLQFADLFSETRLGEIDVRELGRLEVEVPAGLTWGANMTCTSVTVEAQYQAVPTGVWATRTYVKVEEKNESTKPAWAYANRKIMYVDALINNADDAITVNDVSDQAGKVVEKQTFTALKAARFREAPGVRPTLDQGALVDYMQLYGQGAYPYSHNEAGTKVQAIYSTLPANAPLYVIGLVGDNDLSGRATTEQQRQAYSAPRIKGTTNVASIKPSTMRFVPLKRAD